MNICECGCGQLVNKRFVWGHNARCRSESARKTIGNALRGRTTWALGKHFTENHRLKISKSLKGKPHTEEHIRNVREAQKGDKHPWYGRRHTKATRIKMSLAKKAFMKKHTDKALEICRKGAKRGGLAAMASLRKNSPHWFEGVGFDSKEEMQAGRIICERFAITPTAGKNCHVRVNGGEVDFRPLEHLFIEYHPHDWDGLTIQQYYDGRRKLLDENGFQDCMLIVAKSLSEMRGII